MLGIDQQARSPHREPGTTSLPVPREMPSYRGPMIPTQALENMGDEFPFHRQVASPPRFLENPLAGA